MAVFRMTVLACFISVLGGCVIDAPFTALGRTEPANGAAEQLAATEKALDTLEAKAPAKSTVTAASTVSTIQGVGHAVVSVQPGKSLSQKRLLAIRAARMEALRSLTDQIHGVSVSGSTTIAEAVVQSDTLRTTVTGVIRGARTVHIEPQSSDVYEVLLEIDRSMISQMLKIARRGV